MTAPRSSQVWGLAVVTLLLVSGCTRTQHADGPAPRTTSASAPVAPSPTAPSPTAPDPAPAAAGAPACDSARPAKLGRSDSTVAVKGAPARRYVRYLPAAYDGLRRLPLVFNFHGYGANADEQLLYSGLASTAERNGFVVVGLEGQGDPQHFNLRPVTSGGEVSDIVVVTALLDSLSRSLCLDPLRVYATGMSDGGALAAALGCFVSDRFAAVAPVAALVYDAGCGKGAPVPLMAFRGTADEIVPYAGGEVACCGNPVVHATKADIASWAKHNGCRPTPAVTRRGEVETSAYTGCTGGADVVLHTVIGGGHTWPGAIGLPGLGLTTQDIKASQAMWEFFAAHPKR